MPDDFLVDRFPEGVCDLVDALTKVEGEDYETFLLRVARTPGALLIKEADIRDNYGRLHLVKDAGIRDRLRAQVRSFGEDYAQAPGVLSRLKLAMPLLW